MPETALTNFFGTINVFKLLIDGVETVIDEPEGFIDDIFLLERKTLEHGVNWDFSNSDIVVKFKDNNGRRLLLQEYEGLDGFSGKGINADMYLLAGEDIGAGFVEFFRMQFVMPFFKKFKWGVSCTLKLVRFSDKFRARQAIEVDITRSTDMEGNAITPIASTDVIMHSKTIKRYLNIDFDTGSAFTLNPSGAFLPTTSGATQLWSSGYINLGRTNVVANEFGDALQDRGTLVFGGSDSHSFRGRFAARETQEWLKPCFICREAGTYTISYVLDLNGSLIKFPYKRPPNFLSIPLYLQKIVKFAVEVVRADTIAAKFFSLADYTQNDYEIIYSDVAFNNSTAENTLINWQSLDKVTVEGQEQVILFTGATSTMPPTKIDLNVGDTINIHMYYDFDEVPSSGYTEEQRMNITDDSNFVFSFDSFFKIEADTIFPSTKAKCYKVADVLKQLAWVYTGVQNSLVSDFFTSGQGAKLYTTSGRLIRGFTDTEAPPFYSFKKLFDSVNALFCLSINFEKNGSENDIVRVEPIEYVYNDTEILNLGEAIDYEEEVFEDLIYNKIKVGYGKITSGDVESGIGLDDFHTEKTYTTPITGHDNELEIISPYLASGIAIELTRREQKNKNETKDWKYDNDKFLVFTLSGEVFTKQSIGSLNIDTNLQRNNIIAMSYDPHFAFVNADTVTISNTGNGEFDKTHDILSYTIFLKFGIIYLFVDSDFTGGYSYDNATLTYSGDVISERASKFEVVTGTIEPQTAYNLRAQPKRMLLNWGRWINSGLYFESQLKEIKFVEGKGNLGITTRLKSTDTDNRGDIIYSTVTDNTDLTLVDNQLFRKFFLPIKAVFKLRLAYKDLYYLKRAFEGRSADSNNNGYITIKDYTGRTVQIFITKIEYNPLREFANLEGYVKTRSAIPTDENPNPSTDKGAFSTAFSTAFDID